MFREDNCEVIPGNRSLRCTLLGHHWSTASRPGQEDGRGRLCDWCGQQEWPRRWAGALTHRSDW
jgi:hypothetical protein